MIINIWFFGGIIITSGSVYLGTNKMSDLKQIQREYLKLNRLYIL